MNANIYVIRRIGEQKEYKLFSDREKDGWGGDNKYAYSFNTVEDASAVAEWLQANKGDNGVLYSIEQIVETAVALISVASVKEARERERYTQFEMAEKLGVPRATYAKWEAGYTKGKVELWNKFKAECQLSSEEFNNIIENHSCLYKQKNCVSS